MEASFEVNLFDRKLKKAERVVILFRSFSVFHRTNSAPMRDARVETLLNCGS